MFKMKRYLILEYNEFVTQKVNRLFPYTWTGNPTDAIKSKFLQLKDLARPQEYERTEFEQTINNFNLNFRVGEKVKAIRMNAPFKKGYNETDYVYGNIKEIKVDLDNKTLRVFLVKPSTLEKFEVYPETLEKYNKYFE